MINDSHVFAMGLCTPEELETIKKYALKINEILTAFFAEVNIELIDFKLEFGRLSDGHNCACGRDFARIPAVSGTAKPTKNWIRIVSAATSAMLKAHITRSCTA